MLYVTTYLPSHVFHFLETMKCRFSESAREELRVRARGLADPAYAARALVLATLENLTTDHDYNLAKLHRHLTNKDTPSQFHPC